MTKEFNKIDVKKNISNIEYSNIHLWLSYHYGKPKICEFCDNKSANRYEWALIKGFKYSKNRSCFMRLCVPCHRRYDCDGKPKINRHYSEDYLDKLKYKYVNPVVQLSMDGKVLKIWSGAKRAATELNISKSGILNCFNGISKSSAGYKWMRYEK